MRKVLPAGLYGITAEEFSRGRSNTLVVREMLAAGIRIVQYREKENKTGREKYEECLAISKLCREAGALFIVNDHIDIALAVNADGVHIGQDDMPLPVVRRLVGSKIIGLSTHSPEQAMEAISLGADYIGVGPIFSTHTKKNVCDAVGLSYLDWVVQNADIDFVAIGGIKEHNQGEVVAHGAKTIALVTEIVGAEDIGEMVRTLSEIIQS